MLLGNEINSLISRLFSSANAGDIKRDSSAQRAARNEHNVPLMQIVERRVKQRHEQSGIRAVAQNTAFASEVGPPPLTPAAMGR